jgi:hypothetical protein
MFNRKTLFVIGAGAGVDVNLPVGRDLALDIARRTKVVVDHFGRIGQGTGDDHLALSFFEGRRPNPNETLKAFRLIQNGILLANSIDDFLNVHENSPEVVAVGKAAIVRSILYKERRSKLFVDASNSNNKLNIDAIHNSWFVRFMQVLAPGRKAPDVEHVLDGISFINFNYDRCLEQFLIHGLHLLYGIPKEKAVEIVDKADIIHPYGTVGALARVPFGGNEEIRLDYAGLGRGIKTYTERVEEEKTLDKIHQGINQADAIVFLGFAFHKQNMELLFKSLVKARKTRYIFATAKGMSDADKSVVEDQLLELFPHLDNMDEEEEAEEPDEWGSIPRSPTYYTPTVTDHIRIENKLVCSELFEHYAKSLAG